MKHFDFKVMAIAMIAAAGLYSINADAAGLQPNDNPTIAKMRQQVKPVRPFRGKMPWGGYSVAEQNAPFTKTNGRRAAVEDPTTTFGQLSRYDFLEAPDGTTWFYTTEYEVERVEVSEWYTEENIIGYTFTIYDASFKEVGKIKDKITFASDETRVASAVLDPTVSTKFFNTDDKVEIIVYLAMNTPDYSVHFYNKVYSIGGEKDSDGNDKCIATIPGRCADFFNAAADGGEDCYYTFVDDIYPDPSDFDSDDFLGYVNAIKTQVTIYSKATGEEGPVVFMQKDIYHSRYPGDTTDGIYMITKAVNGTPYFIFSQYEKPYFVDPTGFATDENATEDNSFVIEVYGGKNLVSTTKIPVEIKKVEGEINYTFYSIGSVGWKDDVDMTVNGTPQAPAFLVALDYTKASNLEEVASSYCIYGNDGKLIHNLAENTDGITVLAAIEGQQPQALFVNVDDNGDYVFNFVDLYSGEKVLSQHYLLDNNLNDQLTASCQRVPTADGSYQYVFEMRFDDTDDDGNDLHRMAWINKDGSLDRIDKLNMGKDIMYASVNMYADCLSPTLFDKDEAMEYAVLVRRATEDGTAKTEFLVIDDNGKWYAQFSEADGKGSPFVFSILPGADNNRLQMVYTEDYSAYHVDVYNLPFEKESSLTRIEAVEAGIGEAGAVYYDLSGRRVSNPKSGIYVKKVGNSAKKVVVD